MGEWQTRSTQNAVSARRCWFKSSQPDQVQEMKHCSYCNTDKPLDQFPLSKRKKDGRGSTCLECHRAYGRRHYQNNKQYYVQKASKQQDKLAEEVRRLKEFPCADCGKHYPYYVMDFDHREDKKFSISQKAYFGARKQVLDEIKKCDVVCSNCHRERTYQRRKNSSQSVFR